MFQNGQKVVVVSGGDECRAVKVQAASGGDASRFPVVTTDGVAGRDQQVQIVSGGDPTRYPQLRGLTARSIADSVITALTPAAWYRNATGVTSAGGFASQWDDYSGNGRHLKQTTGTNQPAYAAGVFTADGVDNRMQASTWSMVQPVTVYWVGKQVTWTSGDFICDGSVNATMAILQNSATPTLAVYANTTTANNTGLALDTRGVVCAKFNGASSSLRINNNAATTGNAGTASPGGFTLFSGGFSSVWSNATAEEVVIFAAAHDTTTQDSVITAINNALTVF